MLFPFQASKDISNFYASWDLAEVTTSINLLSLLCSKLGLDMKSKVGLIVNKFENNAQRICRMLSFLRRSLRIWFLIY